MWHTRYAISVFLQKVYCLQRLKSFSFSIYFCPTCLTCCLLYLHIWVCIVIELSIYPSILLPSGFQCTNLPPPTVQTLIPSCCSARDVRPIVKVLANRNGALRNVLMFFSAQVNLALMEYINEECCTGFSLFHVHLPASLLCTIHKACNLHQKPPNLELSCLYNYEPHIFLCYIITTQPQLFCYSNKRKKNRLITT